MIKQMENKQGEKTGEMEWNNLEIFAFRILNDASSDAPLPNLCLQKFERERLSNNKS